MKRKVILLEDLNDFDLLYLDNFYSKQKNENMRNKKINLEEYILKLYETLELFEKIQIEYIEVDEDEKTLDNFKKFLNKLDIISKDDNNVIVYDKTNFTKIEEYLQNKFNEFKKFLQTFSFTNFIQLTTKQIFNLFVNFNFEYYICIVNPIVEKDDIYLLLLTDFLKMIYKQLIDEVKFDSIKEYKYKIVGSYTVYS